MRKAGKQVLDLLKEVTRRKVWLFGGIYLGLSWLLLQISVVVEATLELPSWVDQIALVLLALGFPVAILLAWAQDSQMSEETSGERKPVSNLTSGDRPSFSFAVLPFDDLSREGLFAEIADGIPEDIITRLSLYQGLIVAARNSSFAFKGTSPDIRDVGEKLDVRFVLEGSFRKVDENIRITAQLIESMTGTHAWSENFDRPLEGMDTDLDRVVDAIVMGTMAAVKDIETRRLTALDRADLSTFDLIFLAMDRFRAPSLERLRDALEFAHEALEKDRDDGMSLAVAAHIEAAMPVFGSGDRHDHWQKAVGHLERTKLSGMPDVPTLLHLASAASYMGRQGDLEIYTEQLQDKGSWHPGTWGMTAACHNRIGRFDEALDAIRNGRALFTSKALSKTVYLDHEAVASLGQKDFAGSEVAARRGLLGGDTENTRRLLTVSLAMQGKDEEAARELEALNRHWQGRLTLEGARRLVRSLFDSDEMIALQLKGLSLAGLTDEGVNA